MTTEDLSEAVPDKTPLCKGALCNEEMERVTPINVDPTSCVFETGWDKRGCKMRCLVNVISNKCSMRNNMLDVINWWNGSVENKMRAKELMEKLMGSIKIDVCNTPIKGEWCD